MATVLQTIVEKKHYKFIEEEVTWQEAVRLSALSLVEDGSVDEDYYKQMSAALKNSGHMSYLNTMWQCRIPRKMQQGYIRPGLDLWYQSR